MIPQALALLANHCDRLAHCGLWKIQRRAKTTAVINDFRVFAAAFDAYAHDPLLQLTLEREDFATFANWLNEIDVPEAVILEGGYSNDLPELIDAFLTAWDS